MLVKNYIKKQKQKTKGLFLKNKLQIISHIVEEEEINNVKDYQNLVISVQLGCLTKPQVVKT